MSRLLKVKSYKTDSSNITLYNINENVNLIKTGIDNMIGLVVLDHLLEHTVKVQWAFVAPCC